MYGARQAAVYHRRLTVRSAASFHKQGLICPSVVWDCKPLHGCQQFLSSGNTVPYGPIKSNRCSKRYIAYGSVCNLIHFGFILGFLFDPEDGPDIFLNNFLG
jgi:hypothetical protein